MNGRRRPARWCLITLVLLAGCARAGRSPSAAAPVPAGETPWPAANAILAAVAAASPVFPDRRCSVRDHGATGDGRTDDTDAFAAAIASCARAGGGHVDVPPGQYLTGAIHLLDDIDLHLAPGSTVLFSADPARYPIVRTRYEGIELMNRSPMIYALARRNIAITGAGVLDASATRAWNTGGGRAPLEAWSDAGTPLPARTGLALRTSFVQPYLCTNVLIQGVTLRGAQFWQFHPVLSRNVLFDGVTTTDSERPNNDGLDPESCDQVVVRDSTIKARDDAMAIKSGRDADGRRLGVPTTGVVILRTRMASSRWGMITIGSELSAGISGVYAHDVSVPPGDRVRYLLELKGSSRRGGYARDIHLDRITAPTGAVFGAVLFADMHYAGQTGPHRPRYDNITLARLSVEGAPRVLDLDGLATTADGASFQPIGRLQIGHSTFRDIAGPDRIAGVEVAWQGCTVNGGQPGPGR